MDRSRQTRNNSIALPKAPVGKYNKRNSTTLRSIVHVGVLVGVLAVTYCDAECDGAGCVIAGVLSKDVGISFIGAHITTVKVALSNGN